jgi:acyl-Coa thioesterase superfamily protein/acyl-CoA thioesterase superfamily protein
VPQTELSSFDRATAVTRTEGGGVRADLDSGWSVGKGVLNGGYLLGVVGRAALLDSPHPHPVAVSASYLRATPGGPADLTVTPGPAGRTLAHSSVVLAGEAGPSLAVQVTTATLGTDPADYTLNAAPAVPAPEECVPTRDSAKGPAVGLARQIETRLDPATAGWLEGRPAAQRLLRGWIRLTDGRDPDPLALLLFADALPPTAFAVGKPGWAPTVQLQVLVRGLPAPGWCLVEARSTEVSGGWSDEECRVWDSAGRLVAQGRQLARVAR